ncbi:MAG: ABC transporter substrate-binding protein [Odoribacter sp.]
MRKIITLFLLSIISIFTYGQTLTFTPQWAPQSQFAGYYVAQEMGLYKEVGLNVKIEHPSISNTALNWLKQGRCDIITLQLVSAIENISGGVPLVNILQTSQNNALMIVSKYGISSIDQLAGKRIGHWRAGFSELAFAMINDRKLNVEWVPFIHNINLFVSEAIDATLAMSYNEYFQILTSGKRIDTKGIFRLSEMGYNIPEDGLYVTKDFYEKNKDALLRFAEASKRGWQWASQHQHQTVDLVMRIAKEHNVNTNRPHQEWMLKEILALQIDKSTGKASFELKESDVKKANEILLKNGDIKYPVEYNQLTMPK